MRWSGHSSAALMHRWHEQGGGVIPQHDGQSLGVIRRAARLRAAFRPALPLALCIACAAVAGPAGAQSALPVENRIDSAFQNLPENAAELAVPLSRRALAKRASVLPYMPEQPPAALEGFERVDKAASPAGDTQEAARAEEDDVEEGSAEASEVLPADASDEDPDENSNDVFRIPPPRPDPMAETDGPIDLVAAPAPKGEKNDPDLVAAAVAVGPESVKLPRAEPGDPAGDGAEAPGADTPAVTEVARAPSGSSPPIPQPDPATLAALDASQRPEGVWVPPPRPAREGDPAQAAEPAVAGADEDADTPIRVAAAAKPSGPCVPLEEVADKDEDFGRNAAALGETGFCITQVRFKERKRPWTVQTVTSGKPGPLWAVLHDDENDSFDTAVHALQTYGGVLVTVETGGKRNQDGIDPNRNFSDDEISCEKLGKSASPKFTGIFKELIDPSQPIVALHNNFDGAVPTKGLGHVSMTTVPKDMRKVASKDPDGPLAGEHALLLLAASEPVDESMKTRMQALAGRGLNVVLEPVREGNGDCSLSNYAVLSGHDDYFNVTVHHDEGEKQRKMIEAVMTGFPTVSASR
jgi:hypothetical protein